MSMGDPYASTADLKAYLGSSFTNTTASDGLLSWAVSAATDKINAHCDRQFNLCDCACPRIYRPSRDPRYVDVDDFVLTDDFSLATDPSGIGNYEVQWQSGIDYELLPLNGVVGGVPGWPYNEIHAVAGVWFPLIQLRRIGTVQVVARWGWPAVPDAVHQATLIIAHELFSLKDAPFGVAGFSAMGTAVKVRDNPMACNLLSKYERYPILGGA